MCFIWWPINDLNQTINSMVTVLHKAKWRTIKYVFQAEIIGQMGQ